jgi:hypothetical protein
MSPRSLAGRLATLAVVIAALAFVPTADAVCGCVIFGNKYVTSPTVRAWVGADMAKRGVPPTKRRYMSQAIYDWKKNGDFKSNFCRQHPKACRAALACVASGGLTYAAFHTLPSSQRWRAAAFACATAAANVLLLA